MKISSSKNQFEERYDEKSCGVVVFRVENGEKYFLLLHYPGGHFDFVKGHVEAGETEEQTLRRELEEETGIKDLKLIKGFREPIAYLYRKEGKMSNKQVVFFLGKTETKEIVISHEHQGSLWLKYDEALKQLTFDNARDVLKKAKIFLGGE